MVAAGGHQSVVIPAEKNSPIWPTAAKHARAKAALVEPLWENDESAALLDECLHAVAELCAARTRHLSNPARDIRGTGANDI